MSHYLVVAHQTAGSPELLRHISQVVRDDPGADFTLLVPATPVGHRFTWEDKETTENAERNAAHARSMLEDAGANVRATSIGGRVPIEAIQDAIREHPGINAIIISTLPPGLSRWLRVDLISQARKRTGLPVTHVVSHATVQLPVDEPILVGAAGGGTAAPPAGTLERESMPIAGTPPAAAPGAEAPELVAALRAHDPAVAEGYERLREALWRAPGLGTGVRELAILRTAQLAGSEYVWHQHVAIARAAGVPDDAIREIEHWESTELVRYSPLERRVFAYVDACNEGGEGVQRAHDAALSDVPAETLAAVNLLTGFYRMTANYVAAMHLRPERFVGWDLY